MASRFSILTRPFRWFWHASKKKKALVIIILLAIGGYWYWNSQNAGIEVTTVEVQRGNLTESISASGEVDAKEAVSLTFQTAGKLNWVGVSEGDEIKKGQAVASLDRKQLEAQLKKLLNTYEKERTEFDDTSDTADDVTLDEAVARIKKRAQVDLDQTVLDVETQNEVLRLATLYSPIAGIVIKAEPEYPGVNVIPATTGYEIVNPDTIYFRAEVNEIDITKLNSETQVEIELDAYPDEKLTQTIEDISFASTTTSTGGTAYTVKVTLPENDGFKYRLGMNGDASFILSQKDNVLLIPQTAIVEEEDSSYVWIVTDENTAQKKKVNTGSSSINDVEIKEGVTEGMKIIVRPPVGLTEGSKIKTPNDK